MRLERRGHSGFTMAGFSGDVGGRVMQAGWKAFLSPSEPGSQAHNDTGVMNLATGRAYEICRPAKARLETDANVGRELPANVVAQSQADLRRGESRASVGFRNVLGCEREFHPWLQYEALCESQIVAALEPREGISVLRQEQRAFNIKPVRKKG